MLTIAMCDPQKLSIIDELRSFLGYDIKAMVATEKDMLKALNRYYAAGGESVETLIADMEQDTELAAAVEAMEKGVARSDRAVEALADSAPVRKLLNMVLLDWPSRTTPATCTSSRSRTSSRSASAPTACCTKWCRRRGTWPSPSPRASRSWPNLDIAERRMPQDGRIRLTVGGHPVDLRVSVLPTMFGESVVMRILDRSRGHARPGRGRHGRRSSWPPSARSSAGPTASCWSPDRPAPARRPRSTGL